MHLYIAKYYLIPVSGHIIISSFLWLEQLRFSLLAILKDMKCCILPIITMQCIRYLEHIYLPLQICILELSPQFLHSQLPSFYYFHEFSFLRVHI